MRGVILAIILLAIFVCTLSLTKDYCKQLIKYMVLQIKKLALHILLFSWISVVTAFLMSVCYAYFSVICGELLSSNITGIIKGVLRVLIGVDSVFAALQLFAIYSIIVFSIVSCLIFFVCGAINVIYHIVLNVCKLATDIKNVTERCEERRTTPRFKVYLKYNS